MISFILIIFSGLYLISTYNYLLFHFIVEMFTITVSWCTFFIVWNERNLFKNGFFLAIGQSYFFFGVIEMLHMLSYKGMGLFPGFDANLPTQLWIAAGYFSSITFIIASLFLSRSFHSVSGMLIYAMTTILILVSIFCGYFPDCFIEGTGLTRFKKMSEIIICLIFFLSIIRICLNINSFSLFVHKRLILGLIFDIAARMSFIFYISVYGFSNFMGHIFQLISFYFIYQAFVETGVSRPFELLSKQIKQEEKLSDESKQNFENLFEKMSEAIAYHRIITNDQNESIDYVFINVNESFEKYIGLKRSKLLNKKLSEVLPDVHKQSKNWIHIFGKVAQNREAMKIEQFSDKHNRWFDISIFSPKKGHFSTIVSDITAQKQNEIILQEKHFQLEDSVQESIQEIHNKNIELERNKKGLNELAALFSQNLAGPVAEMFKLTTTLNDKYTSSLDENQRILLRHLHQSSYRINVQITSIIQYLQMDQNKLDRTIVDTNKALKNVLGSLKDRIETQNVMIVFQKMPRILCNELIIKTVFINLISNAIKYNDQETKHITIGCLTPHCIAQDHQQSHNKIQSHIFYVQDNGIGIPLKHFETIFRFFYRLHPKETYGDGLGVGLTLVRKMIEQHGGWILVDSEVGHGSTFYFMMN